MEKIRRLVSNGRFRELVRYGVAGVAATVVNYGIYILLTGPVCRLIYGTATPGTAWLNACIFISWLASVTFAFFTNRGWVFASKGSLPKEILAFGSARVLSYAFDVLFVNVAVKLGMDHRIAKLLSNIFVIIINYFASRVIFTRRKGENGRCPK